MQTVAELVPRLAVRATCGALDVAPASYYRWRQPPAEAHPRGVLWSQFPNCEAISNMTLTFDLRETVQLPRYAVSRPIVIVTAHNASDVIARVRARRVMTFDVTPGGSLAARSIRTTQVIAAATSPILA